MFLLINFFSGALTDAVFCFVNIYNYRRDWKKLQEAI